MKQGNNINPNKIDSISSLYLHLPFCTKKCGYCDYYSIPTKAANFDEFYQGVKKELQVTLQYLNDNNNKLSKLKTFYIGGGTPSALPPEIISKLIQLIKYEIGLDRGCEFTIEVNPEPHGHETVLTAISLGANRISLGYQAKQDHLLEKIGRLHSYKDFLEILQIVKSKGLENISCDLMFALPDQTLAEVLASAEQLISLEIPHISLYSLILEEGSLFFHQYANKPELLASEDLEREMNAKLIDLLKKSGYHYYELSSASRPGYHSRHNYNYWTGKPYLGIGPAAHSYFNGIRKGNLASIKKWQAEPWNSSDFETIDFELAMREYAMLAFRLAEGFSAEKFKKRFGIAHPFSAELINLAQRDLITEIDSKKLYRLTPKGLDLANQVFMEFL